MGIFNLFKKKKRIVVNLNSEDLEDRELNQAVLNENAYLKGQLARIKTEEAKKRESEKDKEEEEQVKIDLNEQVKELKKGDLRPISLLKIFRHKLFKKKKINFTTFDGSKILGSVDDFVVLPDGGFGCVSKGNVIWASKDINHVFYWVAGLNNFAKNKMVPLCINSNGEFNPNIQTDEVADLIQDSDGKFRIFKFNKKPLYEFVAEKNSEIQELNQELENTESTIVDQQNEISTAKRETNIHQIRADKAESELSLALHKVAEIEQATGQMSRQLVTLTQVKEINEDLVNVLERVVKKWGVKIEEELGGTSRDKEWEDLKSKLNWAKLNMPQVIYQMPEKEEKPSLSEQVKPVKV